MRPKLENLSQLPHGQSFICYKVATTVFDFNWHYHPEYELTFIVNGKGQRYVGDNFTSFFAGDLVLLPPNLPHTWAGVPMENEEQQAVVVQFTAKMIEHLAIFPEMSNILKLFSTADRGLVFQHNRLIATLFEEIIAIQGINRWLTLIQLLNTLSKQKSSPIATLQYFNQWGSIQQERINKVMRFVHNNFQHSIRLKEVAKAHFLSISAFCKFFKQATGYTFSDFVNEVRIANACLQLMDNEKSIATIANSCGYESLTYFNRVFLKKMKCTPLKYRQKVLAKIPQRGTKVAKMQVFSG